MFQDVPGCSGMFRNVPECSGMFHVPGFIDGRSFPARFRFKMADEVEQAVDATEGNAQNEEAAVGRLTQFPQTRVRNMMKIDPDLHLANRESVFLLTKAAVSLNIITAFFLNFPK